MSNRRLWFLEGVCAISDRVSSGLGLHSESFDVRTALPYEKSEEQDGTCWLRQSQAEPLTEATDTSLNPKYSHHRFQSCCPTLPLAFVWTLEPQLLLRLVSRRSRDRISDFPNAHFFFCRSPHYYYYYVPFLFISRCRRL